MAERSYTDLTRDSLVTMAMGLCYAPGCAQPIARIVPGSSIPEKNYEIAHIVAVKVTGPRGTDPLPVAQRNEFQNLILLCKYHHLEVDKRNPQRYSVAELRTWKADREQAARSEYAGLKNVTEDQLRGILDDTILQRDQLVQDAINTVAEQYPRIAGLLDQMFESISVYQSQIGFPNQDSIELLSVAAHELQRSNLADAADVLASSASVLHHMGFAGKVDELAATTEALQAVLTEKLRELEIKIAALYDA